MARRTTTSTPLPAALSVEQMRAGIKQIQRRISDLEEFDPNKVQQRDAPEVAALEASIDETLSNVFGHNTVDYYRYREAASIDNGPRTVHMDTSWFGERDGYPRRPAPPFQQYLTEGKHRAITLLQQSLRGLVERIEDQTDANNPTPSRAETNSSRINRPKVFVVHGHDKAARETMARFLEKIGLDIVILSEQPDQGMTIIEKFEANANQVGFAVVLLTPDDLGGLAEATDQVTRARQNVIFELGYFAGKLGRGRTCLIRKGNIEIPSDLHGVIYTEMDQGDGWKLKLVKELKAAGLQFDANKVFE